MKTFWTLFAFLLFLMVGAFATANADTYTVVNSPTAVWDSTTNKFYALGVPGQGQSGLTVVPNAGTNNTWTGTNTFTGPTTITSHVGPVPNVCGATCTLTATNAGQTTLLNLAAGSIATLPAATGTGNVYNFVVSTTTTSAKHAILAASSSDAMLGIAIGENGNTPLSFVGSAGTYHSLQMPYAGSQPSGGFKGDSFSCRDIATNVWECNGSFQGGTTPTTPFSTATS